MCDFCEKKKKIDNTLYGCDFYLSEKNQLVFYDREYNREYLLDVEYCPECGRKLEV